MKFKVDENLPIDATDLLRQMGHLADTVVQEQLRGSPDADIASVCKKESRALLTLDSDFADIRLYPPDEFSGLIVLRLRMQDKPHVLSVLRRIIPLLSVEPLIGYLWIVDEERIRIRG